MSPFYGSSGVVGAPVSTTTGTPDPRRQLLPPLCLVAGVVAAYMLPEEAARLPLFAFLPLGLIGWRLLRYPLVGTLWAGMVSVLVGLFLCRTHLAERAAALPEATDLGKVYQVEGRFLRALPGAYGPSFQLDRVRVLSPLDTAFRLDRLVLYVPPDAPAPRRHARVTAWCTLKTRRTTHPIPAPMAAWRERALPAYYGSVKSVRLLAVSATAPVWGAGLSQGCRELLGLVRDGAPAPVWQQRLNPLGVGHLLAISGLHCVFVFMGLQLVLWPVRRAGVRVCATCLGLLAFAHHVGWTASVTRAALMLTAWSALPLFGRARSWLRLWLGLLVTALALQPSLLLLRGFWYSFAASLGLVLGHRFSTEPGPPAHPWLVRLRPFLPIVAAQMFVMPINLMFSGHSRVGDLFWNFMGLGFLFLLGVVALAALIALWVPLLMPAANLLEAWVGRLVGALPVDTGPVWVRFPQHPAVVIVCLAGMAWMLYAGRRELRWYGGLAVLAVFSLLGRPLSGPRLVMLDVGQGLCVLHVDASGTGRLYDAGGKLPAGMKLRHVLALYGMRRLEAAYLSHANLDHYQLLAGMPRDFPLRVPPGQADAFRAAPELAGFRIEPSVGGDRDVWGGHEVRVLWPEPGRDDYPDSNEESLVLALRGAGWWLLLTGDAGTWMERRVRLPDWPGTVLLQVGHHGSKTATGGRFLAELGARYGLVSCGRDNRFRHPHPEVTARMNAAGCKPVLTYREGSILIAQDGLLKVSERE